MTNQLSRRKFLQSASLTGIGLAIGFSLHGRNSVMRILTPEALSLELTPFIVLGTDGSITLVNTYPDMGQGSTQAIPTLIAEELEISLDQVRIISSDGSERFGPQGAGGSGSVRGAWTPMRRAGAAVKEMLIKTAAKRWGVSENECYAENGKILHKPTGKSYGYGELASDASKLEVPANPKLKDPKDFKLIGKYQKRLDVPSRITGKAVFGIDVEVPGMVYACVLHSPAIHGKITAIDDSQTKKIPGVLQVMKCERPMPHRKSEAVAVIATNWWAAYKGRKALKVTWDNGDYEKNMTTDLYVAQMKQAATKTGVNHFEKGDFAWKFKSAEQKLEAQYETPFLSHAPVEPENAIVHVKDDGTVEIWAPVQGPDWAIGDVANYLKVKKEQIKVNVALLGGSFGRKAYHDFLLEACSISKELKKPVKLIWTREDDISQGPYRAGMMSQLQGFVEKGKISGFHHHAIGESIDLQLGNSPNPDDADSGLCEEIDFENNKYKFQTAKISYSRVKTDIPIVWWRSVYASNFSWGQECFLDELAHLAGVNPVKARLDALTDERYKKVLETLVKVAGYEEKLPEGKGRGIAMWKSFGSISAACITVAKAGNGIVIEKVVSVLDCGMYVSPDMVKAQMEGNIVMGLTAAIKNGITFTNGVCDQSNYHQYNVMRINEVPLMEVHLIENSENPGGVGEPALPPIAPALGNAIFAATGKRVRKLPIDVSNI
jgi:isoquinoline 1-oxidoreductase beta subunit